jgi:hypothetical protein
LQQGGSLLFTAPAQNVTWQDVMTEQLSTSLGTETYKELPAASGLLLLEELQDEGQNHYYHAVKV